MATFVLCMFNFHYMPSAVPNVPLVFLQLFLMPETVFIRQSVLPEQDSKDILEHHFSNEKGSKDVEDKKQVTPARMSYRQSLRIFAGRYANSASALRVIWTPFALLVSPTVIVRESCVNRRTFHNNWLP